MRQALTWAGSTLLSTLQAGRETGRTMTGGTMTTTGKARGSRRVVDGCRDRCSEIPALLLDEKDHPQDFSLSAPSSCEVAVRAECAEWVRNVRKPLYLLIRSTVIQTAALHPCPCAPSPRYISGSDGRRVGEKAGGRGGEGRRPSGVRPPHIFLPQDFGLLGSTTNCVSVCGHPSGVRGRV